MSDGIGVRKLSNRKSYAVTWANKADGLVHYKKVGDPKAKPYEVGYDTNGRIFCTCKGFQFRSKCVHVEDFEELGPQLIDIRPKPEDRYPREHFSQAVKMIEDMLNGLDRTHVAGSWRRMKSTIRDLDFVTLASTDEVVRLFSQHDIDITVHGGAVCRFDISADTDSPFQVDIISTEAECLGAALLHATGSKDFNIFLRKRAKARGLKLNRHGLFDRETGQRVAAKTEEAILSRLGLPYIHPDDREDDRWLTQFD